MKRKDVLTWDEYFMGLAHLSALRSKDPVTQVGACIVSDDKKVVGIGYNGLPKGCDDDVFPWGKEGDYLNTKYPFVVHAELNAILNSGEDLRGCSLYVSLFPCNECAKAIIQSGIIRVVFEDDKNFKSDAAAASRKMFEAAGVKYEKLSYRLKLNVEKIENV
ncbi:dCMP deaminase [Breznakia sp. PF5-3]|uniref:deoxycytidylate deaminase n=1 Tax=unclassified Breznakia TaxID=2623764 RepID=UPI00240753CD|nr:MULTISPECIES: dCMP deaminase family protein [unclassified Breznakia]MDF9824088.1 dCMP deaminase [Breznakia sp. PM6-1]MDF9834846.1 dCMP deaminase [Breznakia sp. PF5-3]MDF9837132.1 dCMP deaminase [Breznakia sp. PFB2-8]MDF9859057.1 dCMP deaminase [Breznakia sp. PH5-24]